ncbi:MAG: hypothetical protein ABW220_16105 [Burkholderiaceae bacterium]
MTSSPSRFLPQPTTADELPANAPRRAIGERMPARADSAAPGA